ncbi:MAG TPA: 50S ribosomal protein L35 [Nitrospirales bacterium]|nr:50S ribosomal protein L35 [Nitrospirales bacterium]
MPKMKSHSGVSKRFRKTGTGKIMRRRANRRHILTSKNKDRKRQLRGAVVVDATDRLRLSRLMPYS